MRTIAMFPEQLLINSAVLNSQGQVVSGYVVNGNWEYRSNGTHHFAYRGGDSDILAPVTCWPIKQGGRIVFVPPAQPASWRNYNSALAWAEKQPAFEGGLQDFLGMVTLEAINMKSKRPLSGFEDFDDDIAF